MWDMARGACAGLANRRPDREGAVAKAVQHPEFLGDGQRGQSASQGALALGDLFEVERHTPSSQRDLFAPPHPTQGVKKQNQE